MRTLWIAAAMVAGILATPADAQRVWRNGQWTSLPPRIESAPVVTAGGAVSGSGWSRPAPMPQPQPPQNWQRPPGGTPPVWHNTPPQARPPGGTPRAWHNSRPGGPPPAWQNRNPGSRWGFTINGRWHGGANAPGGWNAYRRPTRGWTVPHYWIAPSFYIQDYGVWGLSAPPQGYTWSRYYDDAVLIDGRGQVYDSVQGIDWEGGSYVYRDGADYPQPGSDFDETDSGGSVPPAGYAPPAAQSCAVAYCGRAAGTYGYGYGYMVVPTTTVVVVQSAPVVTTTTTVTEEVIEEEVVTRRVARRAARRAAPRPRAAPRCVPCACVCR